MHRADRGKRSGKEYDIQADAWTYPSGRRETWRVFGRNAAEMGAEDKQKIGAAFSDSGFSEYLKVQQLIPIMSRFYPDFQEEEFRGRCERFQDSAE